MTLPAFDWKSALKGGLVAAFLPLSAADLWYGVHGDVPWLEAAMWVSGIVSAVVCGLAGDAVFDLPERFASWLWKQFFGSSM